MKEKELGSLIGQYAPKLGALISMVNPAAGIAVSMVASLFGANPADYNDIASKINASSEAQIKLKQLELDHEDAIMQASVSDRESAREREVEVIKATGKRDWMLDLIAMFVIFGFFIMVLINYFVKLTDDHIVTMLIGNISSGFMLVLAYYFGATNTKN